MQTEVTLYINDIKIPITPVDFEYGISSGEMTQIATISPSTSATGSTKGLTYVYRDLGEKYIDLTFNIRTSDKSWKDTFGTNMRTDTDSIGPQKKKNITNPQEFIDWMTYAHGSGEPLKITFIKTTQYTKGKEYTHTLTGTYKVSRTSISSSADKIFHYATFSLGLVRYMPPVTEKVKLVRLGGDPSDISVNSATVESYEPVQTTGGFRVRNTGESGASNTGGLRASNTGGLRASNTGRLSDIWDELSRFHPMPSIVLPDIQDVRILRNELELEPMQWEVSDDEDTVGYFKQLAETTIARALTSVGHDSRRLLRDVFIENPMGLYNRENPWAPLKVLGSGLWRAFRRGADLAWNGARVGLITAAGMVNPVLGLGVEATLNLASGLVSKIPFPSFGSEALDASATLGASAMLDASAETPLLGDGGIVLSYDTDLGFDPKLHATGFDPETISPAYRILKPGIYKKEL
jgi:hypothetical protein